MIFFSALALALPQHVDGPIETTDGKKQKILPTLHSDFIDYTEYLEYVEFIHNGNLPCVGREVESCAHLGVCTGDTDDPGFTKQGVSWRQCKLFTPSSYDEYWYDEYCGASQVCMPVVETAIKNTRDYVHPVSSTKSMSISPPLPKPTNFMEKNS